LNIDSYDGFRNFLTEKGFEVKDTTINGDDGLKFGNSWVTMNRSEAYGDLVCSAVIETTGLVMSKSVEIGMLRQEFMQTTGLSDGYFSPDSEGIVYFEFRQSYDDATSTTTTFWFDEEFLTRVRYDYSPCIIYD
jgi:hypothetical protein